MTEVDRPPALSSVTVATPTLRLTLAETPWDAVVRLLPWVRASVLPSTWRSSLLPSATLLTVRIS